MIIHSTRESWLEAAASALYALFPDGTAAPAVKLSVGFPKGRGGRGAKPIGECWAKHCSLDGQTAHIFISPELTEPKKVLATLLHELVHAIVGHAAGHRKPFSRMAVHVGLLGPWTATTASEGLLARFDEMLEALGEYPHVGLVVTQVKKQTTRMRLWSCACGVKLRAAKKINVKCLDCQVRFEEQD